MQYGWRFRPPGAELSVAIVQRRAMGVYSTSVWCLKRREWNRRSMLRVLANVEMDDRPGDPNHLLAGVSTLVEEMPVLPSIRSMARLCKGRIHDRSFR